MKREPAQSFPDLIVWQKAHQFVLSVEQLTNNFPKSESDALTSQFRRAAIPIPANIPIVLSTKKLLTPDS